MTITTTWKFIPQFYEFAITASFANIQGLLAARGAFDRSRDIIGQKQAKALIEKEFTANFGNTLSPKLDIASILAAQEITNQDTPQTTAPQIPQGLIQR